MVTITVLNKRQIRWLWIAYVLVIVLAPFSPATRIGWLVPVFYVVMAGVSIFLLWNWMDLEIEGIEDWSDDRIERGEEGESDG